MRRISLLFAVLVVFIFGCKERKEIYSPMPVFSTANLPVGARNVFYCQSIKVVGGEEPYTFTVSGSLPGNLNFDGSTGEISGTPNLSGTYNFRVDVRDSKLNAASKEFSIRIAASQYEFAAKWGTDITNNFLSPSYVAVSGNMLFLYDDSRSQIWKFTDGIFERKFAVGKNTIDIAVSGNILYVISYDSILQMDFAGNLLGTFKDAGLQLNAICFNNAGNPLVLFGGEKVVEFTINSYADWAVNREFGNFEYAVDLDSDGTNTYVIDSGENGRMYVFDETGTQTAVWQSVSCNGISIDRTAGNAYLTAWGEVYCYTIAGVLESNFGGFGDADGQFRRIEEKSVCFSNNLLYVADYENPKVQWFTGNGTYAGKVFTDISSGNCLNSPEGIAVATLGEAIVQRQATTMVTLEEGGFASAGGFIIIAEKVTEAGVSLSIDGSAVSLEEGEVTFINNETAIRIKDIQVNPNRVRFTIHSLIENTMQGTFVYVSDTNNHCVKVFDTDGNFLSMFGDGLLDYPRALGVDPLFGIVYVADCDNIYVFDLAGNLLDRLYGTAALEFRYPRDCCVDKFGRLVVADGNNGRVVVFDADLEELLTVKGLRNPEAVAVDKEGNINIADNDFIHVCDINGNIIRTVEFPFWAGSIFFDVHGDVYTAEGCRIYKYNIFLLDGRDSGLDYRLVKIAEFGTSGNGEGEFSYNLTLTGDAGGNLYVCDSTNFRVQKFAPDEVFGNAPELKIEKWLTGNGPYEIKGNCFGKVVVLHFWSRWGNSAEVVPDVNQLYADYGNNTGNVLVLGVASWTNEDDAVDAINGNLSSFTKMLFPNALDREEENIIYYYGIEETPTTVVIGKDGNILWKGLTDYSLVKGEVEEALSQ